MLPEIGFNILNNLHFQLYLVSLQIIDHTCELGISACCHSYVVNWVDELWYAGYH